jgi:D-serine deaminase-like pyridoxal phosphate-dependent protein
MITFGDYRVADPDALETPAMLLFQDMMHHNIRSVCELVGGGQNLLVHVKTHKSEAVARKQVAAGVEGFKCATLKELEMVLQVGARKAILSFPQGQERKIERLCDLSTSYPDAWIATIVSKPYHVEILASVAARRRQSLSAMLDLDAGLHRTGIEIGTEAESLYREIDANEFLEAAGFHWYDGQDEFFDPIERAAAAQRHVEALQRFRRQIESAGMPVPYVVGGGSFSFAYYARTEGMHGSPGTFIYWDWGYSTVMPDRPFRWAALILTQVVDSCQDEGTVTTELGSKAVSADLPLEERTCLIGRDNARFVHQSEEHGVFFMPGELPRVGEYLLAVPGHICPTTILHPGVHVIDTGGEVVDYYPHTARDRL